MKDQLNFDVTDADTIADSDSVGAFLRSSDGTLLTHSDVGGKKALDVSIADGVNVEVDLSHIDDSVRLGDGTSFFTSTSENGDIALDVHLSNSSIVVTATDLDIRDLAFATDSVDVSGSEVSLDAATLAALETINAVQSGVWDIGTVTTLTGITNDVNIADGGNSITVDAVDLDIRDITAVSDSIASHLFDGAGTALTSTLVGGDQALDVNISNEISVNDAALADTAILSAADTLAAAGTAEKVVASNLAARKYLSIYNNDNRKMYIGGSGVDATNGFPISPGSYVELRAGAAVDVYYDSAKNGHAIRTLELS
jgi:hypothetical protein